jgi:hypothetical protein
VERAKPPLLVLRLRHCRLVDVLLLESLLLRMV